MKSVVLGARWLLSTLLVAGAALFAIGFAAERNGDNHHDEISVPHVEGGEAAEHDEGGEAAERTAAETAGGEQEEAEETILGMKVESTPLVVVGVLVSVAFAILVWLRRDRWLLWTVAAFAVLFAVLDVTELVHQINENRNGIAAIAALVAIVHVATGLVSETRATNESAIP